MLEACIGSNIFWLTIKLMKFFLLIEQQSASVCCSSRLEFPLEVLGLEDAPKTPADAVQLLRILV